MSLQTLCGLFGYTRQAYYKSIRINTKHCLEEEIVLERIHSYRKWMPRIGGAKLHYLMNEAGYRISRKNLFTILRTNSLLVRKRKKYAVTTDSRHWMKKYPNLIRGFDFESPNLLWVSDITYIRVKDEFAYLSLITDAYSHKVVGYCLHRTLESEGTIRALQPAIEATPENKRIGLIHHSDRGSQYCCNDYVKLLKSNHIRISMTEHGDPYEHAVAERMNGILKAEWLDMEEYADFLQAQERISQIINTYNQVRPHASCNMLTPMEAEQHRGKLKKCWRKRKHKQKEIKAISSRT